MINALEDYGITAL